MSKDVVKDYIRGLFITGDVKKISQLFRRVRDKLYPILDNIREAILRDLGIEVTQDEILDAWREVQDEIHTQFKHIVAQLRRRGKATTSSISIDVEKATPLIEDVGVTFPLTGRYDFAAREKVKKQVLVSPLTLVMYYLTKAYGLHDFDFSTWLEISALTLWIDVFGVRPILAMYVPIEKILEEILSEETTQQQQS